VQTISRKGKNGWGQGGTCGKNGAVRRKAKKRASGAEKKRARPIRRPKKNGSAKEQKTPREKSVYDITRRLRKIAQMATDKKNNYPGAKLPLPYQTSPKILCCLELFALFHNGKGTSKGTTKNTTRGGEKYLLKGMVTSQQKKERCLWCQRAAGNTGMDGGQPKRDAAKSNGVGGKHGELPLGKVPRKTHRGRGGPFCVLVLS